LANNRDWSFDKRVPWSGEDGIRTEPASAAGRSASASACNQDK
jgi:hypothetical protein